MRIIRAEVTNFASYKELAFEFTERGLTLISGPTGSGKSTFCDIVPWILFGKTAKDGTADEVRSWDAEGETAGRLAIEITDSIVTVCRMRGQKNDLWFKHRETETIRGKDIPDTQRLLNQALGLSYEAYLAGAYFHEFSQTASFFTASAKVRRTILEQIVDLNLPITLSEKLKVKLIDRKTTLIDTQQACEIARVELKNTNDQLTLEMNRAYEWNIKHSDQVRELEHKTFDFDSEQQTKIAELRAKYGSKRYQLESDLATIKATLYPPQYFDQEEAVLNIEEAKLGDTKCDKCGAPKHNSTRLLITKRRNELTKQLHENSLKTTQIISLSQRIEAQAEALDTAVKAEETRENTYLAQLETLSKEINKHQEWAEGLKVVVAEKSDDVSELQTSIDDLNIQIADIELLQEVVEAFRGELVKSTVLQLENLTNKRFSDYFDAEIRVAFETANKDKIDVTIFKDGNECSYTQLSKGQRQILKLCFGISVMKSVQEYNSVNFNCVFLDESMDGLDDNFKTKAYGLLQELALDHESVFIVEHNDSLKQLFQNKLEISLENSNSIIRGI